MGPNIFSTLLFVVTVVSFATGEIYLEKGSPHVKLSNNAILSGKLDKSREGRPYNSFIGVPFGKIPERFEEAVPTPAWKGVYTAVKEGHACVQPHMHEGKLVKLGEEDCLNLNVYVPGNNTQKKEGLNVMVWVHGGGFVIGGAFGFGAKYFMDAEVILVTIQYRLGAIGFLSTGDSVIPGNNGLKDQVLALRWVQENIKNFGGDPKKVTIFGQSAGGASVHYLMLSPTTTGMFHNAISQSATALSPWAYNPNPKEIAMKVAKRLKCPKASPEISSEEILACMKNLTADELLEAQYVSSPRWPAVSINLQFGPVKEPASVKTPFLTESPWNPVKKSPPKEIPWIVGTVENEGASMYSGYIMQDETLVEELNFKWSDIVLRALELDKFVSPEEQEIVAEKIRKFYFGDQPVSAENRQNLSNLYSDNFFMFAVRKAAIETALKGNKYPVYLYQYAHLAPVSLMNLFGILMPDEELKLVGHDDEQLFHFNMEDFFPAAAGVIKPNSTDEEFSKNFVKLWVSFAIKGKPEYSWGTSKEVWKPITKDEMEGKSPLRWYKLIPSNPGYVEGQLKERAAFWDKLYNDHLLKPSSPTGITESEKHVVAAIKP